MKLSVIQETLKKIIISKNKIVEVRILNVENQGIISGIYDDYEKLVKDLKRYEGKYNIFIIMNEIDKKKIDEKKLNRLFKHVKSTTKDADIIARFWILIDIDPVRPTNVSSTDAELKCADEVCIIIEEFLDENGLSKPMKAMSGNGYHLLIPIELDNTAENTMLIKKFLQVLNKRFSSDKAKVDTSVSNAARIIKLYGTIACKGDDTEERPHRKSYIIQDGDEEAVTVEQIQSVISLLSEKEVETLPKLQVHEKEQKIDIEFVLKTHGIEISHEKEWIDGSTCYVLKSCPWNENHTDKSAYVIQFDNGKIMAGCHHDSCSKENWHSLLNKLGVSINSLYPEKNRREFDTDDLSNVEIILKVVEEEGHVLYYDNENNVYASFYQNGNRTFANIKDIFYTTLLRKEIFTRFQKPISKDVLVQTLETLEARALFEGEKITPSVRCKYMDGTIYYFLADKEQTVVTINIDGIKVLDESPIPFINNATMQAQIAPLIPNENDDRDFRYYTKKYWKFNLNRDRVLHDVLLLSRFISDIPAPIIYYMGDRGSAKTTSMKLDKLFVDPSSYGIKALPKKIEDLVILLSSQYTMCFDNVEGGLTADMANILCMASTHGTFSKRKLYTDNQISDNKLDSRLSFSGINTITSRPDFLDRCISLNLSRISNENRKTSNNIYDEFMKDLPYMLYLGFKILSEAIEIYQDLDLKRLPRMADFAKWGYAIAEAMGYGGDNFMKYYELNQKELLELMIEEDTTLLVLISFMKQKKYYKATASDLLYDLENHAYKMKIDTIYGWCKTVAGLSKKLNNSKSVLSMNNIFMNRKKSNGIRYIELKLEEE